MEQAGLVLLVALLLLAAISAFAAGPPNEQGRELGSAIARKLRCAPRLPGPCWRDPLTEAYGRPIAGLVRALAPRPGGSWGFGPAARPRRLSLLPPPQLCRARRQLGPHRSNRRVTAFTSVIVAAEPAAGQVTYWLYRPGVGCGARGPGTRAPPPRRPLPAAGERYLLQAANPRLVPLETLPGRNHYEFPAAEEPPWRWQVQSVYPG